MIPGQADPNGAFFWSSIWAFSTFERADRDVPYLTGRQLRPVSNVR